MELNKQFSFLLRLEIGITKPHETWMDQQFIGKA